MSGPLGSLGLAESPRLAGRRGRGLYWLTVNLAAEGPLLLAVDDLHWCDRPSLRFLAYLVRRLEGLPVARRRQPAAGRARRRRGAARRAGAATRSRVSLHPGPLTRDGRGRGSSAHRLGRGRRGAVRGRVPRVHRRQPAAAQRAAEGARRRGRAPGRGQRRRRQRARPARASRAVLLRLARLPDAAVAVARALAVLGDGAELAAVAALAGLDERGRRRGDGAARPGRDAAPRAAARLRPPARPGRRLPRPPAGRAGAAPRAGGQRCCASWARPPSRSPRTCS